jgi:prepilin peptidase CpaA
MSKMQYIALWPTCAVLAVATFTDLRSRRIPNWLVFPFMAAGLVVPAFVGGWHGVAQSLEGFGLGALIFGLLHWFGGMGMGDVKLVAAIGAWVGPHQLIISIVLTAMVGGIMALVWAIFGGFLGEISINNPQQRKIPYAPAIAIGTLVSFFSQ